MLAVLAIPLLATGMPYARICCNFRVHSCDLCTDHTGTASRLTVCNFTLAVSTMPALHAQILIATCDAKFADFLLSFPGLAKVFQASCKSTTSYAKMALDFEHFLLQCSHKHLQY